MPEPSLRAMATVLAALSDNGLDDDIACIEALKWAHFKDQHIVAYLGLARQLARHVRERSVRDRERPPKPPRTNADA